MEIVPPSPVPTMAPGGATASVNNINSNNMATLGNKTEEVVTATPAGTETSTREQDAWRDAPDEGRNRQILSALERTKNNIQAVLSLDPESAAISVDIKNEYNGSTIISIPSSQLRRYLEQNE